MLPPSPTIEYSPEALAGAVVVRAIPGGVLLTLRPTLRRTLISLLGPALVLVGAAGLSWIQVTTSRASTSWRPGIFQIVLVSWAFLSAAVSFWISRFPILFELGADDINIQWRTLARQNRWQMPRSWIKDLTARRNRMPNHLLKRWCLVVELTSGGTRVLLRESPLILKTLAYHLHLALALPELISPAMNLPPPASCRFQRQSWADGIYIAIPPRGERASYVALTLFSLLVSALTLYLIRRLTSDPLYYETTVSRLIATPLIALIAGAIVSALLYKTLLKLRRRITLFASPSLVSAAETGLVAPMHIQWKTPEIKEIIAVGTAPGRGKVVIIPLQGNPLEIAEDQPLAHLQWVVTVLNAARIPFAETSAPSSSPS